jgi:phage terminase large subunit-like protein
VRRRPRLVASAHDHPAVVSYSRIGRYPVKGKSRHFSWAVWLHPRRDRTPAAEAGRAVAFINSLTHAKGPDAGKPFALRPWQESIVRRIFGTLDPAGYRQIRTAFVFIATRNGKTELAAAIALYMLLGDQEAGAEVFSVAVDVDQASLVFNVARSMIRNDPELASLLEVIPSRRRILHHASNSAWRVIASDAPSALGVNASAIVMDELAAWPQRDIYDAMASRTGSRRAPLTTIITTAGQDEHGVGKEVYDYAAKIRDGLVTDPSFLPIIFEPLAEADAFSEATWRMANPALGDYRSLDEFRIAARHAQEIPGRLASFEMLYLNRWQTGAATPWLSMPDWDAGQAPIDRASLRGRACVLGVDLSTVSDLTCIAALFRDPDGGLTVLVEAFCPEIGIRERSRRDKVPYDVWVRQGYLTPTSGNAVDYDVVESRIHSLIEEFAVASVGVDPWNATATTSRLQAAGCPAIPVRQGFPTLSPACKELERLTLERRIRHGAHPLLRWCASNTCVDSDAAGNLKPNKLKSTEKIDAISALLTGLSQLLVLTQAGSVYEGRGVVTV